MKLLARIFAHAVARRVAYVVVAIALAWLGVGDSSAAVCGMPTVNEASSALGRGDTYVYENEAREKCEAMPHEVVVVLSGIQHISARSGSCVATGISNQSWQVSYVPTSTRWNSSCERVSGSASGNASTSGWSWTTPGCPDGAVWSEDSKSCNSCGSRAPLGAGAWTGVNSDMQMCQDGCTFEGGIGSGVGVCLPVIVDGTTYQHCTSWGPTGDQCSAGVGNGSLAPPDSDGDGTSDGNDSSPNNPGSGGGGKDGKPGEDGSSACGGPGQPACADDGSNSGSGKGNTSGGGGNCQTPPSSTGDAILAQIAYQAWATRCAVEGLGEGGTGTGPGDGDGDGAKEGTLKGIKDFLDGNGQDVPEAEDPWMDGLPGEPSDWNLGLGGGSCPAPVSTSISFGGASAPIEFSFQPMCDLAGLLNTLFKALGALIAAYIIAGVRR